MARVEDEQVRAQLERLLQSGHFRNSRRYPALLRYVVQQTLEGQAASLKERTLGVEVFGRAADYDTAADPVVRVTIAEIRKRIAQYYQETAHTSEVRIELNPGSYVPEFSLPRTSLFDAVLLPPPEEDVAVSTPVDAVVPRLKPAARRQRTTLRKPLLWWWLGSAAAAIMLCAFVVLGPFGHRSAMDRLWSPIFAEDGPVTFCLPISIKKNGVGQAWTTEEAIAHAIDIAGPAVPNDGSFLDHQTLGENVVYSDVLAMMKLSSVVEQQHRPVRVRLNVGSNLNDFREGPTVFIGGLDNQWTLRLLKPLRFHFAGSDSDEYYIQDARTPADKRWSVRLLDKMTVVNHDYALIARVHSEALGRVTMLVAGIGMSGTASAGEFLADPAQVRDLERRIGYKNRNHDFEAVLETDVDDGIAGAARIVALDVH